MTRTARRALLWAMMACFVSAACDGNSPTAATFDESVAATAEVVSSDGLNALYAQFYGASVITSGSLAQVSTSDLPDHPSPYYGEGHTLYVAPHAGMVVNPNRIATQNVTLNIPMNPQVASSPTETDLGAIGVAVNGVLLFNQYAGRTATGWLPLDREIATFDLYNGHPQGTGQYHYHLEPVWLTQGDPDRLIGVLLDGFPVYGPQDASGGTPGDLDVCNGHVGATPEFPDGIYHYHTTSTDPYISGCYRGTPGTRTG